MQIYTNTVDSDSKSNTVFIFTSPTCGQCKMLKPRIEAAASVKDRYTFYEVDTTTPDGMELAQKYNVSMLPSAVVMSTDPPVILSGAGQIASGLVSALS